LPKSNPFNSSKEKLLPWGSFFCANRFSPFHQTGKMQSLLLAWSVARKFAKLCFITMEFPTLQDNHHPTCKTICFSAIVKGFTFFRVAA